MEKVIIELIPRGDWRKGAEWWKKIERIDWSKTNGYAFIGEFLPRPRRNREDIQVSVEKGAYIVHVWDNGSWKYHDKHAELLRATENGLETIIEYKFGKDAILQLLQDIKKLGFFEKTKWAEYTTEELIRMKKEIEEELEKRKNEEVRE